MRFIINILFSLLLSCDVFADYWTDYENCLTGNCPSSRESCQEYAQNQKTIFLSLVNDLTSITPGISCQQGDFIFLGNGIKVNAHTCGKREKSDNCQLDLSTGLEQAPMTPMQSDCTFSLPVSSLGPLRADGECGERENVVSTVSSDFNKGVGELMRCFSPNGAFPQRHLYQALIGEYINRTEMTGVTLSCPNNKPDVPSDLHPGADASYATGEINIYHNSIGSPEILAHEFMHLTRSGSHSIDDANVHQHNHPNFHHPHDENSTESYRPQSSPNPHNLPNRYFDRVYSCQSLCFKNQMVSKEQCDRCMSFQSTQTNSRCQNLISLEMLSNVQSQIRWSNSDIENHCNTQFERLTSHHHQEISSIETNTYGTRFGSSDTYSMSFPEIGANGGGYVQILNLEPSPSLSLSPLGFQTPQHLESEAIREELSINPDQNSTSFNSPIRTTLRSRNVSYEDVKRRCYEAINNASELLNNAIDQFPNDTYNQSFLRQQKLKFNFEATKFNLKRNCKKVRSFNLAKQKCLEAAGRERERRSFCYQSFSPNSQFSTNLASSYEEISRSAQKWNCLTRESQDLPQDEFSDMRYSAEVISLSVSSSSVCREGEEIPANAQSLIESQTPFSHREIERICENDLSIINEMILTGE